jgi:hypothetical protein
LPGPLLLMIGRSLGDQAVERDEKRRRG